MGTIEQLGLLEVIHDEREVVPGVTMIPAPGETPGHSIVRVRSAGQSFYYLGDLFHYACEVEHPDWMDPGRDPETMRRSRDRLMAEAAASHALLVFTHRPFPDGGGSFRPNGLSMGVGIGECTSRRMTADTRSTSTIICMTTRAALRRAGREPVGALLRPAAPQQPPHEQCHHKMHNVLSNPGSGCPGRPIQHSAMDLERSAGGANLTRQRPQFGAQWRPNGRPTGIHCASACSRSSISVVPPASIPPEVGISFGSLKSMPSISACGSDPHYGM